MKTKKTKTVKAPRVPATPRTRKETIKTPRVITVPLEECVISSLLSSVPMVSTRAANLKASERKEHVAAAADILAERAAVWALLDEQGILEPLKAHRDGKLWIIDDGRHRLEWATERGKKSVPILEVSKVEGEALAFGTVIGRQHWTKGQRAWLGVLQYPEVCEAREGNPHNADSIGVKTAPALAAKIGVSADTIAQAVKLYRLFFAPGHAADSVERIEADSLRARWEMLIWTDAGLGGILAGIGGGESTRGEPKAKTGFHHLEAPLASLSRLSKAFTAWDAEERAKACALLTSRVKTSLSPDFRLALAEALAAAE